MFHFKEVAGTSDEKQSSNKHELNLKSDEEKCITHMKYLALRDTLSFCSAMSVWKSSMNTGKLFESLSLELVLPL